MLSSRFTEKKETNEKLSARLDKMKIKYRESLFDATNKG